MTAASEKNSILEKEVIKRKLRRMALEIAEANFDEKEIIIAAINGNGEVLARQLEAELRSVAGFSCTWVVVKMDKKNPGDATLEPAADLNHKVVLLVDDVANTGRTMFYALQPIMQYTPRKLQTVALVERSHKLFPIQTDFAGLSLATTLQAYIEVETKDDELHAAWLLDR